MFWVFQFYSMNKFVFYICRVYSVIFNFMYVRTVWICMICNKMRRYLQKLKFITRTQNTEFEISHEMINEVQQTIEFNEVGIIFLYLAHYIHHGGTSKVVGWWLLMQYDKIQRIVITHYNIGPGGGGHEQIILSASRWWLDVDQCSAPAALCRTSLRGR